MPNNEKTNYQSPKQKPRRDLGGDIREQSATNTRATHRGGRRHPETSSALATGRTERLLRGRALARRAIQSEIDAREAHIAEVRLNLGHARAGELELV